MVAAAGNPDPLIFLDYLFSLVALIKPRFAQPGRSSFAILRWRFFLGILVWLGVISGRSLRLGLLPKRSRYRSTLSRSVLAEFIGEGLLSSADAERAGRLAEETREPLDQVLARLGLLTEREIAEFLARRSGIPIRCEFPEEPDGELLSHCNLEFLQRRRILPVSANKSAIRAAMVLPWDSEAIAGIQFAVGLPVEPFVVTASRFEQRINAAVAAAEGTSKDEHVAADISEDADRLRDMASEEPVVRLVSRLIVSASEARASDIHLEPGPRETTYDFGLTAASDKSKSFPPQGRVAALSRVKILADLDIALNARRSQDGRFTFPAAGHSIDIRVSTIPTDYGESLVLRLLDRSTVPLDLESIGFSPQTIAITQRLPRKAARDPSRHRVQPAPARQPRSMPFSKSCATASARSSPLKIRSNIASMASPNRKSNALIGHDFANALRAILRHDPDVIMVGEIRDGEDGRNRNSSGIDRPISCSRPSTPTMRRPRLRASSTWASQITSSPRR